MSGELFLGQSFGGLQADSPPQFLSDMDNHFLLSGIDANLPWIYLILYYLPFETVKDFLRSRERISKVGSGNDHDSKLLFSNSVQYGETAFDNYISQYGRDSGRRDLLTKILSVKAETGGAPLTDLEIHREVGNLVFAGTGRQYGRTSRKSD